MGVFNTIYWWHLTVVHFLGHPVYNIYLVSYLLPSSCVGSGTTLMVSRFVCMFFRLSAVQTTCDCISTWSDRSWTPGGVRTRNCAVTRRRYRPVPAARRCRTAPSTVVLPWISGSRRSRGLPRVQGVSGFTLDSRGLDLLWVLRGLGSYLRC